MKWGQSFDIIVVEEFILRAATSWLPFYTIAIHYTLDETRYRLQHSSKEAITEWCLSAIRQPIAMIVITLLSVIIIQLYIIGTIIVVSSIALFTRRRDEHY